MTTWSVDAGGTDREGIRRTSGGNPLTGPFYIDGAWPGDTLVVHFNRIRLNRDTAISSQLIVNSALNPAYIEQRKGSKATTPIGSWIEPPVSPRS